MSEPDPNWDLSRLDDGHLTALVKALHEARFGESVPDTVVAFSPLVIDLHVAALNEHFRRDPARGQRRHQEAWFTWSGRPERKEVVRRLRSSARLRQMIAQQPEMLRDLLRPFDVNDADLGRMVKEADIAPVLPPLSRLIKDVLDRPGMFLIGHSLKDYANFVIGAASASGVDWMAFHAWLEREVLGRRDSRGWPTCMDRVILGEAVDSATLLRLEDPEVIRRVVEVWISWLESPEGSDSEPWPGRQAVLDTLENLIADFDENGAEWENTTLPHYLHALSVLLGSIENVYTNLGKPRPSDPWIVIADSLDGARVYE